MAIVTTKKEIEILFPESLVPKELWPKIKTKIESEFSIDCTIEHVVTTEDGSGEYLRFVIKKKFFRDMPDDKKLHTGLKKILKSFKLEFLD